MDKNEIFIKNLVNKLKVSKSPKEDLLIVLSDFKNIFEKKDSFKEMYNEKFDYEDMIPQSNVITPEIFSSLEELLLTIDSSRYETGSYYTSKSLVNRTLAHIKDLKNKKIIDPACGTGNFLINVLLSLKEHFESKENFVNYISMYVFANDLMKTSTNTYVDRLNFIAIDWFKEPLTEGEKSIISKNISNADFLLDYKAPCEFDIIIGNPPYLGTKSLGKEYLERLNKEFGYTDDLYSLFTIKSLRLLSEKGFFSFVTSNTYFTLKSKLKMRKELVRSGLFKIINNNGSHFGIMTNTATFFVDKDKYSKDIEMVNEDEIGELITTNILDKEKISMSDYRFSLKPSSNTELSILFDSSIGLSQEYPHYNL